MPATSNTKRTTHNPYHVKPCCTLSIADIIAIKNKNKNYNRSRSVFSGILNLCPNPGFDIIRVDYATGLQMPGIFSRDVPQDGKKQKIKIVLGHLPRRLTKKHGRNGVLGVAGAIGNPLGIPIYGPELNVEQGVFMFSTEDSCSCRAITAFQGRVLFDVDCFWYAATDVGVQIMDRWCKMMKHFAQTCPQVLDRDLPYTAMTAFVHRHCFSPNYGRPDQRTVFPLWLNRILSSDHEQQNNNNNNNKNKNKVSFSWCDHAWDFFNHFYQQNLHILNSPYIYQYPRGAPVSCPLDHHGDDDKQQQVIDDFQREAEKYLRQHY